MIGEQSLRAVELRLFRSTHDTSPQPCKSRSCALGGSQCGSGLLLRTIDMAARCFRAMLWANLYCDNNKQNSDHMQGVWFQAIMSVLVPRHWSGKIRLTAFALLRDFAASRFIITIIADPHSHSHPPPPSCHTVISNIASYFEYLSQNDYDFHWNDTKTI